MPQRVRQVTDMEIDEVSLVDRPANQHAAVVIAKRATVEAAVPEDYEDEAIYDADGDEVDFEELELGDIVFDADGQAFELSDADEDMLEPEYAEVGKAALPGWAAGKAKAASLSARVSRGSGAHRGAGRVARDPAKRGLPLATDAGPQHAAGAPHLYRQETVGQGWARGRSGKYATNDASRASDMTARTARHPYRAGAAVGGTAAAGGGGAYYHETRKSLGAEVAEELSKAITEADQVAVLSKAFEAAEARNAAAEDRVGQLELVAKSERELRLTREYVSKAAEYNVPVAPEDLGPVLMRMAESMDYGDCAVIHKALTASGALLEEVGYSGEADMNDPFAEIEAHLEGQVRKGGREVSKAQAVTAFFDDNPDAYERYRAERGR